MPAQITRKDGGLIINTGTELNASCAPDFKRNVIEAIIANPETVRSIEFEMSETRFVDSSGLGAIVGIRKHFEASGIKIPMRILNPQQLVQNLFETTHLHLLFEIVAATR